MTRKAQTTKAKLDQWDYIKLTQFYTAKGKINRVKKQPTEWEKIFANHIPDKGFVMDWMCSHKTRMLKSYPQCSLESGSFER